jgi:hypothetical protein
MIETTLSLACHPSDFENSDKVGDRKVRHFKPSSLVLQIFRLVWHGVGSLYLSTSALVGNGLVG